MTAKQSARKRRQRYEEAAGWFLRNRAAERTGADVRSFQAWLGRDPENQAAYAAAQQLMGEARTAILADPSLRGFEIKPRRTIAKPIVTAVLAAGMSGGLFLLGDGPMRFQADAMSGAGEMPVVTLADGSIMQLNASSAVAYEFTPVARRVKLLRGQAFFQVAGDKARPFTVVAGGGQTTALGTAFDVRLGASETDVTVTEHVVSIAAVASSQPTVRVGEGQSAAYGPDGKVREIKSFDAAVALAWRRGQLVVDNAALADVVAEIGRHFSGRIVIASTAVAQRRVSGTIAIADTDAALAFLEQSLGVTATRIGPLIVIRG